MIQITTVMFMMILSGCATVMMSTRATPYNMDKMPLNVTEQYVQATLGKPDDVRTEGSRQVMLYTIDPDETHPGAGEEAPFKWWYLLPFSGLVEEAQWRKGYQHWQLEFEDHRLVRKRRL